jgi:hypothetical protein
MRLARVTAVVILAAGCARAEFVRIEQSLTQLDCASCAESLAARLKRVRGVASASLGAGGFVRLELKPDNTVRLETIRDLAKGGGFTPGEARVRVRGKAVEREGKAWLEVAGLDQTFRLDLGTGVAPPRAGQRIVVEGIVAPPAAPATPPALGVTAVEPEP